MHAACMQVTKYVQREILNHRRLIHPHIVEMREVTVSQAVLPMSTAPCSCRLHFTSLQLQILA